MIKKTRTPQRQHDYDVVYMKMAMNLASLSYAERKKVGAIIISENDQIIAQGYNGTPHGFNNCCEDKLDNGELVTKDEVLHAESNAIAKCARYCTSTVNSTLYVTLSPCINCAKLIIQAEIKRVVYLEDYRCNDGLNLLRKAGVIVEKISGIIE